MIIFLWNKNVNGMGFGRWDKKLNNVMGEDGIKEVGQMDK